MTYKKGDPVATNYYTPNIKFKRFWHYGRSNTVWLVFYLFKGKPFPVQVSLDKIIDGVETDTSLDKYQMPAWTNRDLEVI